MLDMPGVLWPKFEDQEVARKLAFTGAVKDDILDIEALASLLLENLSSLYPQALEERYKIDTQGTGFELLENVGRKGVCWFPAEKLILKEQQLLFWTNSEAASLADLLELPAEVQ